MIEFSFYIKFVFITAVWCVSLYRLFEEGGISGTDGRFYRIHSAIKIGLIRLTNSPDRVEYILKPFIGCVECMASVHSVLVYTILKYILGFSFTWHHIPFLVLVMVSVSFINGLLYDVSVILENWAKFLRKTVEDEDE